MASVGTAMPGLSANRLKGLLLPLPPINEQKRIVSKMEELIPLINRYAKAQQSLDELNQNINEKIKKSCLQEAIQGWPNCPKLSTLLSNPKDVSVENLLERIKEEKQRLVKEGKLKKSALNDSIIFKGDDNKYYEQIGKKCVDITEEIPFSIPANWKWVRIRDKPIRGLNQNFTLCIKKMMFEKKHFSEPKLMVALYMTNIIYHQIQMLFSQVLEVSSCYSEQQRLNSLKRKPCID